MTDHDICARFLYCLDDLNLTLQEVADTIGTYKNYLSALKKRTSPKIPVIYIARFCLAYDYSPEYILLGTGAMKSDKLKRLEEKNDKLIEVIGDMMEAMLELKPKWSDAQKELADKAKKSIQ